MFLPGLPERGDMSRPTDLATARVAALGLCLAILTVGACSGSASKSGPATTGNRSTAPLTAPGSSAPPTSEECPATLPSAAGIGLPEVTGEATAPATLYGLLFTGYPIPAHQVSKIAWRVTGSGRVQFSATGPHGRRIGLVWGPEPHGGSNWNRPGTEWGTGFRFPTAGCWTVQVRRGGALATAELLVGRTR
jgi:hypothetical protein